MLPFLSIHLLLLTVHLLATIAKLLRPGGVGFVVAESLLLKHQLLISSRARGAGDELEFARSLRPGDEGKGEERLIPLRQQGTQTVPEAHGFAASEDQGVGNGAVDGISELIEAKHRPVAFFQK